MHSTKATSIPTAKSFFNFLKERKIIKDAIDTDDEVSNSPVSTGKGFVTSTTTADKISTDKVLWFIEAKFPTSPNNKNNSDLDLSHSLGESELSTDYDMDYDHDPTYSPKIISTLTNVKMDNNHDRQFSPGHVSSSSDDDSTSSDVYPALKLTIKEPTVSIPSTVPAEADSVSNVPSTTPPEMEGITVRRSLNKHKGRRVWDKANICYYCETQSTNLSKHLISKHKNETDIATLLSKAKGSRERSLLLEKVRNLGNYRHNCAVLKDGRGVLIPWRSPSEMANASDYIPCEFCLGFFQRKELWRHVRICKFRENSVEGRKIISRAQMLLPKGNACTEGMKNIFLRMSLDQITMVAKSDDLIVKFGQKLFQRHGHLKHRQLYISQKVREMARFLLSFREHNLSNVNLQNCIDPTKFPLVVSAVQKLCGYDILRNQFSNPSLALKLGHSIKKCATILINEALITENELLKKKAKDFIKLYDADWTNLVSSAALSTLHTAQWNKPHVLPLTEDIKKLSKYISNEITRCLENIVTEPSVASWYDLGKNTLAGIILFNRRRSGEASRMLITEFLAAKSSIPPSDDVMASLSPLEKELASYFMRVEIMGKRGKKVPVLLTKRMCESIEVLLQNRQQLQINQSNLYVFARPFFNSEDAMPGHKYLRDCAVLCGATHPENITSTKLRKHIATVSQLLNLGDHELEQICGFLGHDVRIHREFYRLPEDTLQLAKVSRLLLAMEQGVISNFKGKSLDQIDVTIDHVIDNVESDTDAESDDNVDQTNIISQDQGIALLEGESSRYISSSESSIKVSSQQRVATRKLFAQEKDFLTDCQLTIIKTHFQHHIMNRKIPGKTECEQFLRKVSEMQGKTWKKVKFTVRNEIEKEKRHLKKLQK